VLSIAAFPRIASAAVVLGGRYGAVTQLARQRGVCRQTLYREAHAVVAAVQRSPSAPHRRPRRPASVAPPARPATLPRPTVALDDDRQAQFAATAQALGVSLTSARALLAVLLGAAAPSVSKLGRLAQQAGRQATAALAVLDGYSRPRARQVAADEIFAGRRPVLMTVEQHSLCWLGARRADRRDGAEWAREFQQLPNVEQVTRDGGQGLRHGLALVNAQRRRQGQAEIADQEDHFHLLQRARRALHEVRQKAVRAFRQAEAAQRTFERDAWRGLRRSPMRSRLARQKWAKAEQAFDRWSAQERAVERLRSALRLFTPQGELNARTRAEAEVGAALAELTGPEWTRARRRLAAPEAFTFLDRVHQQLAALPASAAERDVVVQAEGLRRQPEAWRGDDPRAAALRGVALAAGVVVGLLGAAGAALVQAVRGVLSQTWRASSLVEGVNSVLRMQQARQKRLTAGLLDLKRLYWNVRVFGSGRRRGQSPYGRLGLVLPTGSWWDLIKKPPEQLRQQLSALNTAA
jgi:hypothetical protein